MASFLPTTTTTTSIIIILFIAVVSSPLPAATATINSGGTWSILRSTIGITAMHMQLLPNDRVLIYDRTDFGASNISLADGKCRRNLDKVLKTDCTAHSVEYDVVSNDIRPLMVLTDVWCSSGSLMPDGTVVQTGGFNDGDHVIRKFKPCDTCDWEELKSGLINRRWYATNHILPDGRQIIIGGRRQFNYEFYPKVSGSDKARSLPFLVQTHEPKIENNLYPFVFLNPDGHLFIFANNRAILFDYSKDKVVRTFPTIPGGEPRSYPSTGSAVLLPMRIVQGKAASVEVLVCGGAPKGSYLDAQKRKFRDALRSCGRIRISDPDPQWVMETMPLARVMGDMLLLPNGEVLIINGASKGTAGWEIGRNPVLNPVLYKPDCLPDDRFEVLEPTTIPRMYHSTAILLRDGRVLVGGSNPHIYYNFTNVLYPTELSLEAFSPSYLDPQLSNLRPMIVFPASKIRVQYGSEVTIQFMVSGPIFPHLVSVTMVAPSFNTHSFSMNQRSLILDNGNQIWEGGNFFFETVVKMPDSGNIAPAGYYLLFVVHRNIPSEGIWIHIS